ncbi:MAG: hypothetical protein ACRBBN_08495 [Methyloligellaceae bacterium]
MIVGVNYIIWSVERQSWFAQDTKGYTFVLGQAGRYPEDQARRIVSEADKTGDRHECIIAPECNAILRQELNTIEHI